MQTVAYMAHIFRCVVQQHYTAAMVNDVCQRPTSCHIVVDYKVCVMLPVSVFSTLLLLVLRCVQMKVLPRMFRAKQEDFYGLRGMSYATAMVIVNRNAVPEDQRMAASLRDTEMRGQTYYMGFIVDNNTDQDGVAASCLFDLALRLVKEMFPRMETVSFQTDNAAAFATPYQLFLLPKLCEHHGLNITDYVHNEAGDGSKTAVDGHFGVATRMMPVSVILVTVVVGVSCAELCILCGRHTSTAEGTFAYLRTL